METVESDNVSSWQRFVCIRRQGQRVHFYTGFLLVSGSGGGAYGYISRKYVKNVSLVDGLRIVRISYEAERSVSWKQQFLESTLIGTVTLLGVSPFYIHMFTRFYTSEWPHVYV